MSASLHLTFGVASEDLSLITHTPMVVHIHVNLYRNRLFTFSYVCTAYAMSGPGQTDLGVQVYYTINLLTLKPKTLKYYKPEQGTLRDPVPT